MTLVQELRAQLERVVRGEQEAARIGGPHMPLRYDHFCAYLAGPDLVLRNGIGHFDRGNEEALLAAAIRRAVVVRERDGS